MSRASKIKKDIKNSDKHVRYYSLSEEYYGLTTEQKSIVIENIIERLKEKGVWK